MRKTLYMEHNPLLAPLFALTRFGLGILYVLRDLWHRPDRTYIEGPALKVARAAKSRMLHAADLPSHRYEFGAAAIGEVMYVAGGIFQPSVWLPTAKYESYDARKGTWMSLPNVPHVTHHPGVTADKTYLYIVGGCGIRIAPLSLVWQYDPKSLSWRRLPDMPTRRGALGVVYIHGKLYAVGGADYNRKYKTLEIYDIASSSWSRGQDMPTPREHLAVAVSGGKLHALGGYNTDRFGSLTTHEVYDPKSNMWHTASPLPMRLCGFAAVGLGSKVFVFGGEQGWAVSPYVFEYNSQSDTWTRHPDLREARYASTAVAIGKRIHLLGGNTRMFSDDFSKRHDIFVP